MATAPDTVIPNSLNYADIKPQAIENKILLCRYQPTATVTGAQGGDMVKFLMSGNGFLDPYSTYFQFTVEVPGLAANEIRFLDRSAHSFFQRIVIRSQGVEIERIENYDVVAAMINDMLYSPEQCTQHYWEGFPTHQFNTAEPINANFWSRNLPNADPNPNGLNSPSCPLRNCLFLWLSQGGSPTIQSYIGETAFHAIGVQGNAIFAPGVSAAQSAQPVDFCFMPDITYYLELSTDPFPANGNQSPPNLNAKPWNLTYEGVNAGCIAYPTSFVYHDQGVRVASHVMSNLANNSQMTPRGTTTMQFLVPIYSGILGLLMPEKKLLPLNLLPLDIEIVFNRHALYSSLSTGARDYTIKEFYIYGNTLFFEQEIHRTLEASVADHGLFIYCNSFHSAPTQVIQTQQIPTAMYISMNLKSINSVHWVYLYTHYENKACARKLHFVSHNVRKLQLLNGTQLIPQYPIEGNMGTSKDGSQQQFIIELYKAWNKMHDPARDGSHHAYNTCGDQYAGQFDPLYQLQPGVDVFFSYNLNLRPTEGFDVGNEGEVRFIVQQIVNKQANVGRCQYGISMEGEELGSDRTMITGRKSQYPFQLQQWTNGKFSSHASYMMPFLRADFVVYIRPDLQIVTLGK